MDILATPEFWVAVSFFLFLGLVFYLGVHKKIGTALDARAAAISKEIDEARALREEAESVLADYRKKQGDAANEAQAIVDLASKEAEALATIAWASTWGRDLDAAVRAARESADCRALPIRLAISRDRAKN